MFQNDHLKKLDERYNNHAYTGLMGIFMRYCHEQLEKVEFPKNISKVLEIGAGSAPHIEYIKHNFDEYHIIETSDFAVNQNFNNLKINYDYFLISHKKLIKDYPKKKLEELLHLIKNEKCDVAYDGNDAYHTELVSKEFLENYIKKL